MAGLVWKLRCALLYAKFFSDLKDTSLRTKTYRDFQEMDSTEGFSYEYSVFPLFSNTNINLQVQFDSEWQTQNGRITFWMSCLNH